MTKKYKKEIISTRYMPKESRQDVIGNIQDSKRFFVATPDIANLGYNVIEWLHENPKTKNMTHAEWCAILGIALFELGRDNAMGTRYSTKANDVNKVERKLLDL